MRGCSSARNLRQDNIKLFCKLLKHRIVGVLEKEDRISEAQAGFRRHRGCVDHVFTLGRIIKGMKRMRLKTCCFFLDMQNACNTVWRNALWKQLSICGINGEKRIFLKNMTVYQKRCHAVWGTVRTFQYCARDSARMYVLRYIEILVACDIVVQTQ